MPEHTGGEHVEYEADRPGREDVWAATWRGEGPLVPHMQVHPGIEVGVVLAGMATINYAECHIACGAGQVWLCNMWEPHESVVPDGTEQVVVIFRPEFVGDEMLGQTPWLTLFAAPSSQRPQAVSQVTRRRVLALGKLLSREVEEEQPNWQVAARALLLGIFVELLRAWEVQGLSVSASRATPFDLAKVMPAVGLVHSLPWRRVRVSEAAAACGLSPSRFHEVFRRTTGLPFGAFCLRARLSFAANRLRHTRRSISAIATEAGFADESHFRRRFFALYKCTPAEYRKRREDRQAT